MSLNASLDIKFCQTKAFRVAVEAGLGSNLYDELNFSLYDSLIDGLWRGCFTNLWVNLTENA